MKTSLSLLAGVSIAGLLSGCAPYLDRVDTIAFSDGNAVQANIVQHTIDPWPAASARTQIAYDGQRAVNAVDRYRKGKVILRQGSSFSSDSQSASDPGSAGAGGSAGGGGGSQ